MKIPLTLNDRERVINADPDATLLEALRNEGCRDVKCGCGKGLCGSCAILLDGAPVPACVVPVAAARNCSIVTLNHFKTLPPWEDIKNGFAQAGLELCGYCDAGKVFAAASLLSQGDITEARVLDALSPPGCRCADQDTLTAAILSAAAFKDQREKRGTHAK